MKLLVHVIVLISIFFRKALLTDNYQLELENKEISTAILKIEKISAEQIKVSLFLLDASQKHYKAPIIDYKITKNNKTMIGAHKLSSRHELVLTMPKQKIIQATYIITNDMESFLKLYFNKLDGLKSEIIPLFDWLATISTTSSYIIIENGMKYKYSVNLLDEKKLYRKLSIEPSNLEETSTANEFFFRLKCTVIDQNLKIIAFNSEEREFIFSKFEDYIKTSYIMVRYSLDLLGKDMEIINTLSEYFKQKIGNGDEQNNRIYKQLLIVESSKVGTFLFVTIFLIYYLFIRKSKKYPGYRLQQMKERLKNKLNRTV